MKAEEIKKVLSEAEEVYGKDSKELEVREDELAKEIETIADTATNDELLRAFELKGEQHIAKELRSKHRRRKQKDHKQYESWADYLEDKDSVRDIRPDNWFEPKTLDELEAALNTLCASNTPTKAFGARHASSAVARPVDKSGSCIDLKKLRVTVNSGNKIGVDLGMIHGERLIQIEAGVSVKLANKRLEAMKYALPNMGSYNGQSLIGAMCTGTHGSNRRVGPMAEFVRAIDMYKIEADHTLRRIRVQPEGADIPLPAYDIELIEDTDLFYNLVVSMGCMGIVFCLVIQVEPAFWLEETREFMTWLGLRDNFNQLRALEFADIIVNPNKLEDTDGQQDNLVLFTKRTRIAKPPPGYEKKPVPDLPLSVQWFAGKHPKLANKLLNNNFKFNRPNMNRLDGKADDPDRDLSHKIFFLGGGDYIADSIEIAVNADRAQDALQRLLDEMHPQGQAEENIQWMSGPIGVRFVPASKHHLSFAYGQNICTFEITILKWQKDRENILKKYHNILVNEFDGRPHWGQTHWVDQDLARSIYPKFDEWLEVYRDFNVTGLFSNEFTRSLSLDD